MSSNSINRFWAASNFANNESGFSAIAGGYRTLYSKHEELGTRAWFWTSLSRYSWTTYARYLQYNETSFLSDGYTTNDNEGLNIRCVKND